LPYQLHNDDLGWDDLGWDDLGWDDLSWDDLGWDNLSWDDLGWTILRAGLNHSARAGRGLQAPRTSVPETQHGGVVFPKRDADITAMWDPPIVRGAAAYGGIVAGLL
jgi:hypothetical protein